MPLHEMFRTQNPASGVAHASTRGDLLVVLSMFAAIACSLANTTAARARSMGSVPTINKARETMVSESPLNCTKN